MAVLIRTLLDPDKHILGDFNKDYFCERASNNEPFNSTHFVYIDGEFIGCVFRQFSDEPWQYKTRGEDTRKDAFEGFRDAVKALHERFLSEQEFWQKWVENPKFVDEYWTNTAKEKAEKRASKKERKAA